MVKSLKKNNNISFNMSNKKIISMLIKLQILNAHLFVFKEKLIYPSWILNSFY